jgi:hypothetical protein
MYSDGHGDSGLMTLAFPIPGIGFGELVIFLILVFVGVIILMILAAVIHFILPIIAAVVVWFFTHSLLYAGIAFLAVAIIQLIIRRR